MIRAEDALEKSGEKEVDRVRPGEASLSTDSRAGLGRSRAGGRDLGTIHTNVIIKV